MADETRRITYEGSPALARQLVQGLEDEGVEIQRPPRPREETHDIGDMSERVVVDLVVKGRVRRHGGGSEEVPRPLQRACEDRRRGRLIGVSHGRLLLLSVTGCTPGVTVPTGRCCGPRPSRGAGRHRFSTSSRDR